MADSSYLGFGVIVTDADGQATPVGAGVSVAIRVEGEGSDAAGSPLHTDAYGLIAAGTLSGVDPGTKVFFRVENYEGRSGSIAQITT
mgnify:CR=1 FL=1